LALSQIILDETGFLIKSTKIIVDSALRRHDAGDSCEVHLETYIGDLWNGHCDHRDPEVLAVDMNLLTVQSWSQLWDLGETFTAVMRSSLVSARNIQEVKTELP
jgi:hypothetical protein